MDASTLRWILIVVGILIVGSIFLFGNPNKKKAPKASRRRAAMKKAQAAERREPTLDGEPESVSLEDMELGGQGELNIGATPEPELKREPERKQAPLGPPPDRIVTLFLLARDNHVITGADLLQATVSTGMEFGDMKIFHRVQDGASITQAPGATEALMISCAAPLHALDAWDSMLAAGRRMSEILQADLLDEERSPFTRQREAQIREEMREYDRTNNPSA